MRCSYCNDQIHKLTRATFIACVCKQTNYCDQRCQKEDWGKGGHRDRCEYWAKVIEREKEKERRQEKQREHEKRPNALGNERGPKVISKNVKNGKSGEKKDRATRANLSSENVETLARSKNVPKRPKPVEKENNQQIVDAGGIAFRDSKGRFLQCDSDKTEEEKNHAKAYTANYKDFRAARGRLQAIIDRNKKIGVQWAFKIACNKNSKWAHQGSHQWESENYAERSESESDDENNQPSKVVQRVCKNCKNQITGPQWSYLVCAGSGCRNGMTHYSCIGFKDISVELAAAMKKEYLCKSCHRNLEERENEAADFAKEDLSKKKRNCKTKPPTLKDRIKKSRKSKTANGSPARITVSPLSGRISPARGSVTPPLDDRRSAPPSPVLRRFAAPQARRVPVRSPQARRSAVQSPLTRRSAFQFPDDRRSATQSTGDGPSTRDKSYNAHSTKGRRSAATAAPVVDSPLFEESISGDSADDFMG